MKEKYQVILVYVIVGIVFTLLSVLFILKGTERGIIVKPTLWSITVDIVLTVITIVLILALGVLLTES